MRLLLAAVVSAILLAATRPAELVAGKSFNIGMGSAVTLLDLLKVLQSLTRNNPEPEFLPPRTGYIRFSQADISLARDLLAYNPQIHLQTGLSRTLDFYRSVPAAI